MKINKKIILGASSALAVTIVPMSVVISCGIANEKKYHLDGKSFSSKQALIEYAKKQLSTKNIGENGKRFWKISNGDKNQYFSSAQELRGYIFRNKIETEEVFVPNKYKFETKDGVYNSLNDNEISSFSKGVEGTYYAFRISGGKRILSKPLTGDPIKDKEIYEETKLKAIDSFLQIHQIYRYKDLYFPNKETLKEYLSRTDLSKTTIDAKKYTEFHVGSTGIKSSLFSDVKNNAEEKKRASSFIKNNSQIGMRIKDSNNRTVFKDINEILSDNTINKGSLLEKINYLKVNSTKKRFLIDIQKQTQGSLLGNYVIDSNGQVSRIKDSEKEWKETKEKFDSDNKRNKNIENALNIASDLAFYSDGSTEMDILDSIASPNYLVKNSKEQQQQFMNFKTKLNSYETQMDIGLGDALWERQTNLANGKRFSSIKSIFYLRTWLMDKIIRNNITDPELISLTNKFFNNAIKLLTQKFREVILPIAGPKVAKAFDLSKMVNFEKQKNLFIDPEILMSSFYTGRYKIPGSSREKFDENIIIASKAIQVYFAVESYKAEKTESIKERFKKSWFFAKREMPKYDFVGYKRDGSTKSMESLRNIMENEWNPNGNFSISAKTKSDFIKQVELFLKRNQKQFRLANDYFDKNKNNAAPLEWGMSIMSKIISKTENLSDEDRVEVFKINGALIFPMVFPELIKQAKGFTSDFSKKLMKGDSLDFDNMKQEVISSLSILKEGASKMKEVKETIEKLHEHYVIARDVFTTFKKDMKEIKKAVKTIKNAKDIMKTAKKTMKTMKEVKKAAKALQEISNIEKIMTAAPSPWGMVASLAFDLVLNIVSGIMGETKIDGFKFEYGEGRSENVIWTGARHTDHKLFGFISWKSDVVDLSDLDVINPVELTGDYKNDEYKYNGKSYKNTSNLIIDWINNIKMRYLQGMLSKEQIKDLGLSFKFNSYTNNDLDKLTEEVIKNSREETFVLGDDNDILKDNSLIKHAKINKILKLIKPIWVAQLPEVVTKNHKQNYENKKYAMPITEKIKLYKHENENLTSNNKYLFINPNVKGFEELSEQEKKEWNNRLVLSHVSKMFKKMFDDDLVVSKHISLKDALSDKQFDELPNGFALKEIYTIKNNDGQIEKFLDLNDAIDWMLSKSNYGTIPRSLESVVYVYKDREFVSITDFIKFIMNKQKHPSDRGGENEKDIYK